MDNDIISLIESEISLFERNINFQEILENIFSEYSEENNNDDLHTKRNSYFERLQYRFQEIYELDILNFDNGDATLSIKQGEGLKVRKYLHKFLLFFDCHGARNVSRTTSTLFEKISMNAVKNYLGEDAHYLLISKDRLNRCTISQIAEELSEEFGTTNNVAPQAKDGGVDFIVYKPIDMRKVGNVIILGQATLGKNFQTKQPINTQTWNEYITFKISPMRCLTVVQYLEKDCLKKVQSDFHKAMVFDRGRLIKYYNPNEDKDLNDEISSFDYEQAELEGTCR